MPEAYGDLDDVIGIRFENEVGGEVDFVITVNGTTVSMDDTVFEIGAEIGTHTDNADVAMGVYRLPTVTAELLETSLSDSTINDTELVKCTVEGIFMEKYFPKFYSGFSIIVTDFSRKTPRFL